MEFSEIWNTIMDSLIVPIIVAFATFIAIIGKSCANRITKSIITKNEIATMESQAALRERLIAIIDNVVKSAVASNMQMAESMKETSKKLSEEQITQLNESAMNLIMSSLPPEFTDPESEIYKLIGGESRLDAIIKSTMEKYVYEYKIKTTSNQASQSNML